jgi:hypothetical protein
MSATFYDPDKAPNPGEWLAIDEHERIRLAQNYHTAARINERNPKAHAVFHATVENQIAQGYGPSVRAVERLQREGLTRHEAIHAIASVVAEISYQSIHTEGDTSGAEMQRTLNAKIESLSAATWKAGT